MTEETNRRCFLRCIIASSTLAGSATLHAQGPPEEGIAVHYSDYFQGRPVANGETFDQEQLTAAHNRHQYGTRVRVTNLKNDKSVVVTINDRMRSNRRVLIDVSRKAAEELDFVREGRAQVKVEVVE
jgi:peptidoglycan lytic transglycosylase